jgi:hypothetical protein
LYVFLFSPRALHNQPISSFFIYYVNNAWWLIQIMELLNRQFSPASCHFLPLRSKHSPQDPALIHHKSAVFP